MCSWNTLIEPRDLASEIEKDPQDIDLVIVDCRFALADETYGKTAFGLGHIPGASYADLERDLSGEVIPGSTGRHPLPGIDEVERVFRELGISNESQVVAYDDFGGAFAARLWWMLGWLGHDRAAVLNGGWPTWESAGYPTTTNPPSPRHGSFTATPRPERLVTSDDIDALAGNPDHIFVDARAYERYLGETEPLDPVAGHIPGARSAPFKNNLDETGRFLPPATLRALWSDILGSQDSSRVVSYCGSGVTGAHNALALQTAGLDLPSLYAGSWSDWITRPDRAVETGPGK